VRYFSCLNTQHIYQLSLDQGMNGFYRCKRRIKYVQYIWTGLFLLGTFNYTIQTHMKSTFICVLHGDIRSNIYIHYFQSTWLTEGMLGLIK
jgi:hypothetical protein